MSESFSEKVMKEDTVSRKEEEKVLYLQNIERICKRLLKEENICNNLLHKYTQHFILNSIL